MFNIGISGSGYTARENTEDGPIEVWVPTLHIEASNAKGQRFVYVHYQGEGDVEDVAKVILNAVLTCGSTPDTRPDDWSEADPIYGSEAWDGEAEYSLACFEADCFNEPRPRW